MALWLTVVFQFIHVLVSGRTQPRVLAFGQALSTFFYQIAGYLTFNSEERPWPFAPWPEGGPRRDDADGQESNVDGY